MFLKLQIQLNWDIGWKPRHFEWNGRQESKYTK